MSKTKGTKWSRFLAGVAQHSILIALSIVVLMPVIIIVMTSLMTPGQTLSGDILPSPLSWNSFPAVFTRIPFVRYFLNTVFIALSAATLTVLSSIPAAYALSVLRFRGRDALFLIVVAAMMLPGQVTVIPLYVMWAQADLIGTPVPLILPFLFMDAFSIFLLRQFFVSVPKSYIESARIDGASEFQIIIRVFLPMVKSALAAVFLFAFFYHWNDYFNPLLYLSSSQNWYTLSLALASFRSSYNVDWNLTMAATTIFILPVIVIFALAQRSFVQGISLSGVKG